MVTPSLGGAGRGWPKTVSVRSSENVFALGATVRVGPGRRAAALLRRGIDGAGHRHEGGSKLFHGVVNFLWRSCNLRHCGGELKRGHYTKAEVGYVRMSGILWLIFMHL